MLDELLVALGEVSKTILPFLGVVVLIFLILVLYRVLKVVKALPETVTGVNKLVEKLSDTVDSAHGAVDKLNEPLDTIIGVSKTVDSINRTATGIVGSVASYAMKHSDAIGIWAKGLFGKNNEEKEKQEEEDFGIYE